MVLLHHEISVSIQATLALPLGLGAVGVWGEAIRQIQEEGTIVGCDGAAFEILDCFARQPRHNIFRGKVLAGWSATGLILSPWWRMPNDFSAVGF